MRVVVYYMASSVSGQGEPYPVLWLATGAGKMRYLARSGLHAVSRKKILFQAEAEAEAKSYSNQACSFKMAGC